MDETLHDERIKHTAGDETTLDETALDDTGVDEGQLDSPASDETVADESAAVEETSARYLGRWSRLVSTTNWEKGRIICEWRHALIEADASPESCTDEAWSRRVGNVSPQHAGRLRRVFQKFGSVHGQYEGLFWSHFQVAMDWDDAEMWLEGAVQNGWSIGQMRAQRWEAIGSPADEEPRAEDVIVAEYDEDVEPREDRAASRAVAGAPSEVRDTGSVNRAFDEAVDDDADDKADGPLLDVADRDAMAADSAVDRVRPFENLASLPSDLSEAFEAFKLAIVHHRLDGWRDVSCDAVLDALAALRQLALAPADES